MPPSACICGMERVLTREFSWLGAYACASQGSLLDGHVPCKWWKIYLCDSAQATQIYIAFACLHTPTRTAKYRVNSLRSFLWSSLLYMNDVGHSKKHDALMKIQELSPSYTGTTKATTWQTEWAVMAVNYVQSHWSHWVISPNLRTVCLCLHGTLLGQLAVFLNAVKPRLSEFLKVSNLLPIDSLRFPRELAAPADLGPCSVTSFSATPCSGKKVLIQAVDWKVEY